MQLQNRKKLTFFKLANKWKKQLYNINSTQNQKFFYMDLFLKIEAHALCIKQLTVANNICVLYHAQSYFSAKLQLRC